MPVIDAIAPAESSHEDSSRKTNIVPNMINKNNNGYSAANVNKDFSEPLNLPRNYSLEKKRLKPFQTFFSPIGIET